MPTLPASAPLVRWERSKDFFQPLHMVWREQDCHANRVNDPTQDEFHSQFLEGNGFPALGAIASGKGAEDVVDCVEQKTPYTASIVETMPTTLTLGSSNKVININVRVRKR